LRIFAHFFQNKLDFEWELAYVGEFSMEKTFCGLGVPIKSKHMVNCVELNGVSVACPKCVIFLSMMVCSISWGSVRICHFSLLLASRNWMPSASVVGTLSFAMPLQSYDILQESERVSCVFCICHCLKMLRYCFLSLLCSGFGPLSDLLLSHFHGIWNRLAISSVYCFCDVRVDGMGLH
jgi:hypothetical protein